MVKVPSQSHFLSVVLVSRMKIDNVDKAAMVALLDMTGLCAESKSLEGT